MSVIYCYVYAFEGLINIYAYIGFIQFFLQLREFLMKIANGVTRLVDNHMHEKTLSNNNNNNTYSRQSTYSLTI